MSTLHTGQTDIYFHAPKIIHTLLIGNLLVMVFFNGHWEIPKLIKFPEENGQIEILQMALKQITLVWIIITRSAWNRLLHAKYRIIRFGFASLKPNIFHRCQFNAQIWLFFYFPLACISNLIVILLICWIICFQHLIYIWNENVESHCDKSDEWHLHFIKMIVMEACSKREPLFASL